MTDFKMRYQMEVPVQTPPQRVVSLVPSMTESLFDLNLGARVIGVTDYCTRPAEGVAHLPRIGGTKNPDIAAIVALNPDLVMANPEENRREDVEALQAAGIAVWVTFPRTVADVFNVLWNVMYVFDETSMVPRVRLIEQTMDWVQGVTKTNEDYPCRVFVPIWYDPLMTFNADTYSHDVLRVCGGTNVFANRERRFPLEADLGQAPALAADDPRVVGRDLRYPRISMAEVEASQPDVILLPDEPFAFTAAHIPLFKQLDVPAAHHNRIHLVDGALLTWHGTRLGHALMILPELLPAIKDA